METRDVAAHGGDGQREEVPALKGDAEAAAWLASAG